MNEVNVLFLAFILSNAYWAFVCLKLTNRVMSRNYSEYVTAARGPVKKQAKPQVLEPDEFAEAQAKQLNAILHVT
jgi:hypothetical protein